MDSKSKIDFSSVFRMGMPFTMLGKKCLSKLKWLPLSLLRILPPKPSKLALLLLESIFQINHGSTRKKDSITSLNMQMASKHPGRASSSSFFFVLKCPSRKESRKNETPSKYRLKMAFVFSSSSCATEALICHHINRQ